MIDEDLAAAYGAMAKDDLADFFRGKTVQIIIPASMGGSVALYGRLAAEHLGNHIPGNPTVIAQAMPGAGGLRAVEYVLNVAAKDGTVIGEILSPALLVPLTRTTRLSVMRGAGRAAARGGTRTIPPAPRPARRR